MGEAHQPILRFSHIDLTYETPFCYNRLAFKTDSSSAFLYRKARNTG